LKDQYIDLVNMACKARLESYSPYSKFRVGAALLATDGRIFLGANVENASFGLSNCAERTAVFSAVAAGAREFEAIAICADNSEPTAPCGACRQVLVEFGLDIIVIIAGQEGIDGAVRRTTVRELVPDAFATFRTENQEGS
jgi:cytidine deaminase